MAIKFKDKPQGPASTKAAVDLKARFATPIGADDPVNPDAAADAAFSAPPAVEKTAASSKRLKTKR